MVVLKKVKVKSLTLQCSAVTNKERRVQKELGEIMDLYNEKNNMRILYNKELNSILTRLADLFAPYLSKANSERQ